MDFLVRMITQRTPIYHSLRITSSNVVILALMAGKNFRNHNDYLLKANTPPV